MTTEMTLELAHAFIRDALESEQRVIIQYLTDEDIAGSSRGFVTSLGGIHAATFRDLELTLDLAGNLDASL